MQPTSQKSCQHIPGFVRHVLVSSVSHRREKISSQGDTLQTLPSNFPPSSPFSTSNAIICRFMTSINQHPLCSRCLHTGLPPNYPHIPCGTTYLKTYGLGTTGHGSGLGGRTPSGGTGMKHRCPYLDMTPVKARARCVDRGNSPAGYLSRTQDGNSGNTSDHSAAVPGARIPWFYCILPGTLRALLRMRRRVYAMNAKVVSETWAVARCGFLSRVSRCMGRTHGRATVVHDHFENETGVFWKGLEREQTSTARQVHLAQGRCRAASNSLEQALSFSFRVGKNPVFLLVKASVQKEEGNLGEALETFEEALR